MSDNPSDIPRTSRITLRLPTDTLADLDTRAASAGASRSDYLRALVELPLRIDVNAIRRTRRGLDELTRLDQSVNGLTLEISDPPGTVVAVTDEALDAIRAEVNAIGVNYNQAVKSLNRVVKKYARNKHVAAEEKDEIYSVLKRAAKQNEAVFHAANAIAAKVDELLECPTVELDVKMKPIAERLPLTGETRINKQMEEKSIRDEAAGAPHKKRRRTRGKRKRLDADGRAAPLQASSPGAEIGAIKAAQVEFRPTGTAGLLHPVHPGKIIEKEPVSDNPVMPSASQIEQRDVDESTREDLDEMMGVKNEEAEIGFKIQKRERF